MAILSQKRQFHGCLIYQLADSANYKCVLRILDCGFRLIFPELCYVKCGFRTIISGFRYSKQRISQKIADSAKKQRIPLKWVRIMYAA